MPIKTSIRTQKTRNFIVSRGEKNFQLFQCKKNKANDE